MDETSLAWMGYAAMCKCFNTPADRGGWDTVVVGSRGLQSCWEEVSKIIADEAIRRYKAAEWPQSTAPTESVKPSVDILKLNAEMSGR